MKALREKTIFLRIIGSIDQYEDKVRSRFIFPLAALFILSFTFFFRYFLIRLPYIDNCIYRVRPLTVL